jgi:hypothetical protein
MFSDGFPYRDVAAAKCAKCSTLKVVEIKFVDTYEFIEFQVQ